MNTKLDKAVERWVSAGLMDASLAGRIRAFETEHEAPQKFRWPVLLAVSLGGVLLGAGVLLFVAAHWDDLSPSARFSLVLLMVAMFHVTGALLAERFAVLATVMHAVGTVALGAGIFLAGQIFNLEEHWPGGVMLWAAGAWLGFAIRRDWVQGTLAAVLTPYWLAGEWIVATERLRGSEQVLAEGTLLLAIAFLTARTAEQTSHIRRSLGWVGGLALIPCTFAVLFSSDSYWYSHNASLTGTQRVVGWLCAIGLPLVVAFLFRGRGAWMNALAAAWVVVLGTAAFRREGAYETLWQFAWYELGPYFWCGLGSVGLVLWGLKEGRRERINLGVAGFGITVISYYFADVMDKLSRSTSLIGLGLIFLIGGWSLERARRRLMSRLNAGGAA